MTKPSNQKKVLELVKNDIVSIDEALTLTDEETVFLHTCSNPTEVVLIPDYAYGENEVELEAGELLFCYRKGEISLDTHYVYNARDFYNERFFKFVPKAPLEEKKQKIQRFKEKYELEFKKYISELNLSGISNFLDDYNYQKANTSLIFGDKEFTALVIFRLVTSEDYEMWDTIIWDEENFEFVKKENPKPMPKTKAGKKNRITY